jgi:hypothetical protein
VRISGGTSQRPPGLTPFQFRCASEVARVLGEQGLSFSREQVEGEEESYFVFRVQPSAPEPLQIYVYEDEAGFFLGKRWHIWETQDYDTPQGLMNAFLDGLQSTAEQLSEQSPAVP